MQKTPTKKDEMKHIYIYIFKITGVNDSIKQQRYPICPPQLRLKYAQGRDYMYIKAGTFTQEHCSVFVGRWLQCSPAAPCYIEVLHLYRWYTHTDTDTLTLFGSLASVVLSVDLSHFFPAARPRCAATTNTSAPAEACLAGRWRGVYFTKNTVEILMNQWDYTWLYIKWWDLRWFKQI